MHTLRTHNTASQSDIWTELQSFAERLREIADEIVGERRMLLDDLHYDMLHALKRRTLVLEGTADHPAIYRTPDGKLTGPEPARIRR